MAEAVCPIAYDHTDDLDECAVCGWTGQAEPLRLPLAEAAAVNDWIRALNQLCSCGRSQG